MGRAPFGASRSSRARAPCARREPVDLYTLARDVVEMTRARWHDQAEARGLRYDVSVEGGAVPPALGDAADLREVLTNLVFNALDAMPQGGRLTLRTVVDGARVRCDVLDTGVGMTPDLRARVFEPFFSTKTEKGSGLGLSIVYGIVTRLGGEITVESTPGVGSAFRIWLADRRRGLPGHGGGSVRFAGGPGRPNPRGGRRGRSAPGARRHAGAGGTRSGGVPGRHGGAASAGTGILRPRPHRPRHAGARRMGGRPAPCGSVIRACPSA